jgi:hypothetical protein
MALRISTTLDLVATFGSGAGPRIFGGESVLSELLDSLDHGESAAYTLQGGEQDVQIDFGDVLQARLVYLEGDGEFSVEFGGGVPTSAIINAVGGTYPTAFVGGETLDIEIDGAPLAIVFAVADQTLVQVLARINYFAALASLPPVAFDNAGQIRLKSPTTGLGSTVEVVAGGTALATLGLAAGTAQGVASTPGTSPIQVKRPADTTGASAAEGVKSYFLGTVVASSIKVSNLSADAALSLKSFVAGDLVVDASC